MSRRWIHLDLPMDKVEIIMRRYGLETPAEAVELALDRLAGEPMTREQALAMRGRNAIGSIPEQDGRPSIGRDTD